MHMPHHAKTQFPEKGKNSYIFHFEMVKLDKECPPGAYWRRHYACEGAGTD